MDIVKRLAIAIAHAEGFYENGSLPQRANNPGDLEMGDLGHGTIAGKTIFSTADVGWDYLYRQCAAMLSGKSRYYKPTMTLEEIGLKYSGGDPNWAKNVAAALQVSETTTLADIT